MTEAEWQTGIDPWKMLESLQSKATDRKLRLLICGWARLNMNSRGLTKQIRSAIEMAEDFADGLATDADVGLADAELWVLTQGRNPSKGVWLARLALGGSIDLWPSAHESVSSNPKIKNKQVGVLQDIFGNPFRSSYSPPSALFSWNDNTVSRIAQGIYDERAYDRLPILADALEEAGCDNADILNHCRQPGPHARGCWVVDLLLGKS